MPALHWYFESSVLASTASVCVCVVFFFTYTEANRNPVQDVQDRAPASFITGYATRRAWLHMTGSAVALSKNSPWNRHDCALVILLVVLVSCRSLTADSLHGNCQWRCFDGCRIHFINSLWSTVRYSSFNTGEDSIFGEIGLYLYKEIQSNVKA